MTQRFLDIIFLSYNESNGDENWQDLKARFPRAQRVHGIEGIQEAHQIAAQKSSSHFFFLVDGDNRICSDFAFETPKCDLQDDTIYVWRCRNPANQLVYGYGAVKLYNKTLLSQKLKEGVKDLASTLAPKYTIISDVASETYFFATPEEAWRGAFRECAKLASECIKNQNLEQTKNRLRQWCENVDQSTPNSEWIQRGALQGKDFGLKQKHSDDLEKINDFKWLHQQFLQWES